MNSIAAHRVKLSFEWFVPCGAGLIAKVMRNLADNQPGVRALFPEETAELNRRLFSTLGQVVRGLDNFDSLRRPLGMLGVNCAREGANTGHYSVVKNELLMVMAELAGEDWTPELAALWDQLLEAVTGAMVVGAIHEELRRAA